MRIGGFNPQRFRTDANEPTPDTLLEQQLAGMPTSIDWTEYFNRFKQAHGEPVLHKDRILFPDGWSYNAHNKAGPEYPPPPWPELHKQLTIYWLLRRKLVMTEMRLLEDAIKSLRELARTHSLPLLTTAVNPDSRAEGKLLRETLEIDIDEIENGRLAWLQEDTRQCQERLAELERLAVHVPNYQEVRLW